MEHRFANVCLDCEWSANTDEHTRTELSDRTIEHAIETGHDVTGRRVRDDRGGHATGRPRAQAGRGPAGNGRIEPDRTAGDRRRVYRVSDDFLDESGDGGGDGDGGDSNDDANDDRGRTDGTAGALTRGDFEADLRRLVRRAYRSGVPIDGCDVRFPDAEILDYTIEIHELRDSS